MSVLGTDWWRTVYMPLHDVLTASQSQSFFIFVSLSRSSLSLLLVGRSFPWGSRSLLSSLAYPRVTARLPMINCDALGSPDEPAKGRNDIIWRNRVFDHNRNDLNLITSHLIHEDELLLICLRYPNLSRLTESNHKILRMFNGRKYYEGEALTVTSILGK